MKLDQPLLILLLLAATTSVAYSWMSADCLSGCFKTGHDCNYCNYMCNREESGGCVAPNYSGDTECPLLTHPDYYGTGSH